MSFSEKYIAKIFSLKKFLVSECIFKLVRFCESCSKSGICFTQSVFAEHKIMVELKIIVEQIGIGIAYLHVFFNCNA